jgi:glucose-6-phosphate 1-dehydrogenase
LEILMPVTVRAAMRDFVILGAAGDLAVRKLPSASIGAIAIHEQPLNRAYDVVQDDVVNNPHPGCL